MRTPQRIPIYLELIKNASVIINGNFVDFSTIDFEALSKVWKENPDWRLTQLLVNIGIIPNTPGFWYYVEDAEFLISLGFQERDVVIWGNNFDKDMNRLPETIWRPIKDLTTDHVEAILKTQKHISEGLKVIFEEEFKLRKQ